MYRTLPIEQNNQTETSPYTINSGESALFAEMAMFTDCTTVLLLQSAHPPILTILASRRHPPTHSFIQPISTFIWSLHPFIHYNNSLYHSSI